MRDRIFYTIAAVVIAVLLLGAICATSGCKSFGNFIGGTNNDVPDPGTSAGRLWHTIKQTKQNLFTSWAIPIIALGVTVMWSGRWKLGMGCVIFGSVNLFVSLATAKFALPMAIFGFIGTMLAVLASILSKNKALTDLICGIQKVKVIAKEDNVDLVFQDKIKGVLDDQLTSTKKIVKKVKTKLKLAGKMVSTKTVQVIEET